MDNSGKMTARKMKGKWERYKDFDGYILVVATKEHRMHKLRAGAELVKDKALFTTFDRLLNVVEPWTDWYGNTVRI